MVTAVVGAGGKTTLIRELSARYRAEGRRVLVTTSTHMYREPSTLVDAGAAEIVSALRSRGFAMAGSAAPEGKIGPLPPAVYAAACAAADEVLVEADGARGHLVKLPGPGEPVIDGNVTDILLVINLKAEGQPLDRAAHRPAAVAAALGVPQDTPLTAALLTELTQRYWDLLAARWPDRRRQLHINARPEQQALAEQLRRLACSSPPAVLQ